MINRENFIFILPKGITLPEDFGYKYIEVDHLLSPSVIFTGAYMTTPNSADSKTRANNILSFIKGLLSKEPPSEPIISKAEVTNVSAPVQQAPVETTEVVEDTTSPKQVVSDVSVAQQESPFFRHIRIFNKDGNIASCGGLTLAIDIIPETNSLVFSYALCNPLDNFVKATSRQKAEGRLQSARFTFHIQRLDPTLTVLQNIDSALCGFVSKQQTGNPIFENSPYLTAIPSACTLEVVKRIADHIAAFNDKEAGINTEF